MRKLLFVLPAFRYGGTMTSFENLLILLSKEDYEIDVYAIVDEGEARNRIAKTARIINSPPKTLRGGTLSFRHFAKIAKDCLAKMGFDIGHFLIKKRARKFNCDKYDAIIAYQEGYPTDFVAYANAKYKIAWIHSMYSRWGNSKTDSVYDIMNSIVCVSETAKKNMLSKYHNNISRIHVVKNSLDKDSIFEKVASSNLSRGEEFRIISVGRIDPVKRFSQIPNIANVLSQKGLNFKWSIVGGVADKKEHQKIIEGIRKFKLEKVVLLEGQMSNPYPAIKNSDLLVCLSSSETFNYTLTEARILRVPVVTSDFPSAKEFIIDGQDGIITSIDKITETISALIEDKDYYQKQKESLREYQYDNKVVIEGFRKLIAEVK